MAAVSPVHPRFCYGQPCLPDDVTEERAMGDPRMYEQFITHDDVEPQVYDDEAGDDDRVDVVDGPIGSAAFKEPSDVESAADPLAPPTLEETVDATSEPASS